MKFRMGQMVWVKTGRKTDGRYNRGKIVGLELCYRGLGYLTERQYLSEFGDPAYKVAYVDCFTQRGCVEWLVEANIQKEKPE